MRICSCLILTAAAVFAGGGMDAFLAGLDSLEKGEFEQGVVSLLAAVEAEPDNPDFRLALGVACVFHEKLGLALEHLDRADRLRRGHAHTRMWRATAIAMQGRFREDAMIYPPMTRDAYETAVRTMSRRYGEPAFKRVQLGRPDPQEKQKRAAERKRFPALARRFVSHVKPKGARLGGALRKRGLERLRQGQYRAAYGDLAPALARSPDDLELRFHMARCRMELGAVEGARRDLTVCLTHRHRWGAAYAARARAYRLLGASEKARADDALAVRYGAKPVSTAPPPASGPVPEAEVLVRRVEATRLRADETYQERLRKLREAGDLAELGAFLFRESQVTLTEQVEPRAPAVPFRRKEEMRELTAAEKALDGALAKQPDHAKALAYRAACFVRRGAVRAARTRIERAIELAPSDPDVLAIVAHVLEYAARVNRSAAQGLRAVDTWEDAYYIYHRYPSEAERRQAAALEREARRLRERARAGLVAAADRAKGTPRAAYYRGLLTYWDGDAKGALAAFSQAARAEPARRDAWLRVAALSARLGRRDESYEAMFRAASLDHTTAAPLLKLAWIHIDRHAFDTAGKLVARAMEADPADPRGAAYRGVIEELQGRRTQALKSYRLALALHEAGAKLRGVFFAGARELPVDDAARRMQYAFRAAECIAVPGSDADSTSLADSLLRRAAVTYEATEISSRYTSVPRAMLPGRAADHRRLRDETNVETIGAWVRLRQGNRAAAAGRHDEALRHYVWVAGFESRKPPNRTPGSVIRGPAALARAYRVESLLASGGRREAAQRLLAIGSPRGLDKPVAVELERIRQRVEKALGGDLRRPNTLTEMRRRALIEQRDALVERKKSFERILADPDADPRAKAGARIEIADLAAQIRRLDDEIVRVGRGR